MYTLLACGAPFACLSGPTTKRCGLKIDETGDGEVDADLELAGTDRDGRARSLEGPKGGSCEAAGISQ